MKPAKNGKLTETEYLRFLSKIGKPDLIDQCWLWGGALSNGYGTITIRNRKILAHRLSYSIFNGPLEDGVIVRHKCDNTLCVNPKHLETGTYADNNQDRYERENAQKYNGMSRIDFELVENVLMPRSNKLESFGPAYEQLLLRAYNKIFVEKEEEFTIQLPNPKVANSIRMRMYTFFRVLDKSGTRPDLSFQCKYLSMRLAGSALIFYHVNEDVESKILREALGLAPGFDEGLDTRGVLAPESGHSSNLDRLREIRDRKTTKG